MKTTLTIRYEPGHRLTGGIARLVAAFAERGSRRHGRQSQKTVSNKIN
jgi:hypothetical protein